MGLPLGNLVWRIPKGSNYFSRTPCNWGSRKKEDLVNLKRPKKVLFGYLLEKEKCLWDWRHIPSKDGNLDEMQAEENIDDNSVMMKVRMKSIMIMRAWARKVIMRMTNQFFWVSCQVTIITLPATTIPPQCCTVLCSVDNIPLYRSYSLFPDNWKDFGNVVLYCVQLEHHVT